MSLEGEQIFATKIQANLLFHTVNYDFTPPNNYSFQLHASNQHGLSDPASTAISISPPGPPSALELFHIDFWITPRVHFQWQAPESKTPPVSNYKFFSAESPSTQTALLEKSETPFTKFYTEAFSLEKQYHVQVSAVNAVGEGPRTPLFLADLAAINWQLNNVCAGASFFTMSDDMLVKLLNDCMNYKGIDLLSLSIQEDTTGEALIHKAAKKGSNALLNSLIYFGAPLDILDDAGQTPLIKAVYYNHTDAAKLLIDAGAQINIQDNNGETALHKATFGGYLTMTQMLVDGGASVNVQDNDGETPLHQAAYMS